jgi:Amidohydrolase family
MTTWSRRVIIRHSRPVHRSIHETRQDLAHNALELTELISAGHAQRHGIETHLFVDAQVLDAFGRRAGSGPAVDKARRVVQSMVGVEEAFGLVERRLAIFVHIDVVHVDTAALAPIVAAFAGWEARAAGRRDNWSAADFELARRAFAVGLAFAAEVRRAGGKLLVGSDAPNPFVVPGASLHRELELLVQLGMSPMEVLVAATRVNAEALGLGNDLGMLAPGKLADVVLLEANPLEDIANSRAVRLVLQAGEVVAGAESSV